MKRVSLFKRGLTWWVYYRIQDQRVRKSLETHNKKIAQRKAEIIEQKLINNELKAFKGRLKLSAFWDKYLPHAQANKRPKTVDTETRNWKVYLKWVTDQNIRYMDQVTQSMVDSFSFYLLALPASVLYLLATTAELSLCYSCQVDP